MLSKEEKLLIVKAIEQAEKQTSGEIRVRVERRCDEDVMDRAAWWFKKLKMHRTQLHNGVLIYVATDSRKMAIIGDFGINSKVETGFWDSTYAKMKELFSQGKLAGGISAGVEESGIQLKKFFPYEEKGDKNELTNEISMEA